jgi:hypothetical protein
MARISTYTIDNEISGDDLLVGTNVTSGIAGATMNYSVAALSDYISVAEQMKFRYVQQPLSGTGTFSPTAGGTDNKPFSTITNLVVAIEDRSPQNVVAFLTYLVGSDILIVKQDDVSNFGHYKIDSYTVNASDVLTYIGGSGSLKLDKLYNIVNFVKADDVGDKSFTFTQINPSATWNITHNLGKFPSVSVVDTANTQVFTDVQYTNNNNLTLTFSAAFAGKAYLN